MIRFVRGSTTITEARQWLLARRAKGVDCPLCAQRAKEYPRAANYIIARCLKTMARISEEGSIERETDWVQPGLFVSSRPWIHIPSMMLEAPELKKLRNQGGYRTNAHFWGLVQESGWRRADHGRSGWWRITPLGLDWVKGNVRIHKYARVYNGRLLQLEGPLITIEESSQLGFNYQTEVEGDT